MNIQQFQYVLAVAEHRHFETAAEMCFVSQSTLSTMIAKFEDEIGIVIFDRKKKPVVPTKEGETIIERIKIILHEIIQFKDMITEMKGEIKGVLSIGCIPTVAAYILPSFLPDFSRNYLELLLEITENTTSEIIQKLKKREIDIGILSTPVNDDDIVEYPLYKEPFVLFDVSGKSPKNISIEEIDLQNFWLMEEGHCMRSQVMKICELSKKKYNIGIHINFKAGSIESLIRFAKGNKGKTLLPLLALQYFSKEEFQYVSSLTADPPFREIGLVTHRNFVKKKLLSLLQHEITNRIIPQLQKYEKLM